MATNSILLAKVSQIEALLNHCNQALTSLASCRESPPPPQDAPNPLHLLRDTAKLLHAHATKIGLLLINEPFTHSAVQKELVACEETCVPGMVAAVEACHPQKWTASLAKEARLRVQAAVGAFALLLADVKNKTSGSSVEFNSMKHREKTLASTGKVWEACDALVALERRGLSDAVLKMAKEQEDMMRDALEELREWRDDEDDQDEGFVAGSDDEADEVDSTENMFSGSRLPAHREDIKALFDQTFTLLKLIGMLLQAITKRRAKTFTTPEYEDRDRVGERITRIAKVNEMLEQLQVISEGMDEVAGAFYELHVEQAKAQIEALIANAYTLATCVERSWDDTEDEFTTWSKKWRETMSKQVDQRGKGNVS